MNRSDAIEFGGKGDLPGEDLDLLGERGDPETGDARIVGADTIDDPAIEADFADAGAWIGGDGVAEALLPEGGTLSAIPRVDAIARQEPRVFLREFGDEGPFFFMGSVDHAVLEANALEISRDDRMVRMQFGKMKMKMSVVVGSHENEVGRAGFFGEG